MVQKKKSFKSFSKGKPAFLRNSFLVERKSDGIIIFEEVVKHAFELLLDIDK